ncbi:conjugal transfer protein TraX (plasmid) [Acetobacter orientalis]|uniref:Conjugal transfer protein TraX n=1 Tax=Acetobacter orientalis TaxID=146474 RepID=A0A2Z5ZMH3_9PROT|nr:conjugal transfer protein TraX [Acetobacter orientalis]
MSAASIGIEGALEALDGAAGVASVRAWMERHREALLAHQDGRRINWRALCAWFASVGLLNGKGETPTVRCAQLTWYRVGKWLERRNERAAERAAEALRLEAERESEKAAIQAEIRQRRETEALEKAALRDKMEKAERAAAWRRDEAARVAEHNQRVAAEAAARKARAAAVASAQPTAGHSAVAPAGDTALVTLDLPQIEGVSYRAYEPFDPTLPPIRKGEINPLSGNAWEFGDDLPGYPSKRGYEFEDDWLRDVGRLLRARHDTTSSMTEEEKFAFRIARGRGRL